MGQSDGVLAYQQFWLAVLLFEQFHGPVSFRASVKR